MKYTREQLTDNIGFTAIIDPKFKTNTISVKFITDLCKETNSENSIAVGILATSNAKYKTLAELTAKLSSLYGSSVYADVKKRGDIQVLSLGASWIDNSFTIGNEDINSEMIEIFSDCIFHPNADGEKFDLASFNIRKNDLLDKIEAEINNRRGYAISQALETAFCGEPAAYSPCGKRDEAEAVTPESAFKAYKNLMKDAQIEIFFVSPSENNTIKEKLASEFAQIERSAPKKYGFSSLSSAKGTVANPTEELDVNQAKMVMVLKSDLVDEPAMKLMSTILGETPFSKLFANVREKLSLCYYCASSFIGSKNSVTIDSGIETSNIKKAETEILNQLEDIKNGNFELSDIENSVLTLEDGLTAVGDVPSGYISWYFSRFCEGDFISPLDILEKFRTVSKERIIEAAKSLKLDTIYLMVPKEVK